MHLCRCKGATKGTNSDLRLYSNPVQDSIHLHDKLMGKEGWTHSNHAEANRHPQNGGEERDLGRVPSPIVLVCKLDLYCLAAEIASKEEGLCACYIHIMKI